MDIRKLIIASPSGLQLLWIRILLFFKDGRNIIEPNLSAVWPQYLEKDFIVKGTPLLSLPQ